MVERFSMSTGVRMDAVCTPLQRAARARAPQHAHDSAKPLIRADREGFSQICRGGIQFWSTRPRMFVFEGFLTRSNALVHEMH